MSFPLFFFCQCAQTLPQHGGGFIPPGPCCSHTGGQIPQPGQCAGSKGSQEHHAEGLPGGTVLSLQRRFLRSIFTLFPCSGSTQIGAGSFPAGLAPAQEFRGGVTAPPSPCRRTGTGATPSTLLSQQEEIPSRLHGLKAAL